MELKDIIAQQQALQQQQAATGAAANSGVMGGVFSGAAKGASAGSSAGPYGALIGGVIGGFSGYLSGDKARLKAQKELKELSLQNSILENQRLNLQNSSSAEFKLGGQLTRFKGEGHAKGGIRIGKDEVEGEETMLDDYIFSNYLSPKGSNKTFAELTKSIDDKYYRKNDPFSDRAKNSQYADLRKQQDEINEKYSKAEDVPKEFRCGGSRKVGKDVMGRKYVMGGSLGEKYAWGGYKGLDEPLKNQATSKRPNYWLGGFDALTATPIEDTSNTQTLTSSFPATTIKKYAGEPWRNVGDLNAEQAFTEAGIPYTDRTRYEFEKASIASGALPKYGADNVFGTEYSGALNAGLSSGSLSNLTVPAELQGLSAPSLSSMSELSASAPPELQGLPSLEGINLDYSGEGGISNSSGGSGGSGGKFSQLGSIGGSLLQSLPGLISAASNFKTADKVNYGRIQAQTVDPNLLDPRRALQEVGTAYSGANQALGNLQGGQYLSNRIASAASEANARGGVAQKYDEANAQILNRTDLSNASARSQANLVNLQQATQQTQDRLQATGQGYEQLSNAASAAIGAYNTNQRDAKMLPYLGTENFPVYMDTAGNPTLDFESSRDGVDYNKNVIGRKARAAKSKKKN